VQDRENRARFSGINVLKPMPGSCSWTSFSLAVTNDAGDDKMRIIHDGTEGDTESITKFTTLMNGPGGFSVDMTGVNGKVRMHRDWPARIVTNLGKPPGELNFAMSLVKPARSLV
jgi:hypothetical protein